MSERTVYEYAVVRVVPRVERDEFVNVGVALYCRKQKFAQVKIYVDEAKCKALDPTVDLEIIKKHLDSFQRICVGDKSGGRLAELEQPERFRWLTAKRSTMVQCSVTHPGTCVSAAETLDELFKKLVL
ncbi:DUF3037 domain-containing protein [Sphingobacterium psychroaquaticum]|uniref:Uncharacterized protein n=1 Tax=Sphingobacterium psychroaquaticum TaxID=561061 RepID=A0A1X7KMK6_9SPHI|nr:DUF3037 domain-containing protein [Sphingobacterium psychroaquaticum]QBQ40475.1 DUF3037 domain-containing protein [Sphingobacterium psychroaquaticum]SMG42423.1 Protein of unknown function [Sphingobacterium psychroaquaticum]